MSPFEKTRERKADMSAHGHWRNVDGAVNEMIAWNTVSRALIKGDVVTPNVAARLVELASTAGKHLVEEYQSGTEGLSASDISRDEDLVRLSDELSDFEEGAYFEAVERSERLLLSDCRHEDDETQKKQRSSVRQTCESVRSAYETAIKESQAPESRVALANAL